MAQLLLSVSFGLVAGGLALWVALCAVAGTPPVSADAGAPTAPAPPDVPGEVVARFDEAIDAPVRLRVCGLLAAAGQVEFGVLREALGVSDATLSKHLKVLVGAGFVEVHKAASTNRADARRPTWLRLTREGRAAFSAHVAELRAIAQGIA